MRPPLRLLAVLSLAAGLTTACRQPPELPWQRTDLWAAKPRVEASPFRNPAKPPYRDATGYLGAAEVRDLAEVPPETFTVYPHQAAGQVRSLEQVAGSRLSFPLQLGREAYFTFTPILDPRQSPGARFRVLVRRDGGEQLLATVSPTPPPPELPPLAPAAERVELPGAAGEVIELLLEVEAPESPSPGGEPFWGAWASPSVFSRGSLPARPRQGPPNLILIGVDTLRADHVGAFRGSGAQATPSLTPALDRLAADSDLWLDAYSTFNVTNPSFASILTGLYGKNHGVYDLKTPLPESHITLAEVLSGRGYESLAVISAHHLGPHNSALGQGFGAVELADEHFAAEAPVEIAMSWIAERQRPESRRPFFLWLHLFDPHTPHTPPRPYAEGVAPSAPNGLGPPGPLTPFREGGLPRYAQPVLAGEPRLYASEVAYVDHQLDRLLDFLRSRGRLDDTVIALVADHGENLGEHGILCRHIGLWETTTHVPLAIRWPAALRHEGRGAGQRFTGLVQTIDLFPTLLGGLGVPVPPQDGEDLYQLTAAGQGGRRAVFSEDASHLGVTVRSRDYRLVRAQGNPVVPDGSHLYALTSDPGEEHDLAGQGLAIEAQLARVLDAWLADRRDAPEALSRELSPAEIARLKALGYL